MLGNLLLGLLFRLGRVLLETCPAESSLLLLLLVPGFHVLH